MDKGIHSGHRERMRTRASQNGLESFSDHELVELLLYYSMPRINTNEIAHGLLDRFDSIKGILDAGEYELQTVKGVGKESAILLKLLPEILRRYLEEKPDKKVQFDTLGRIGEYLYSKFIGLNCERMYMMLFNNRMNLLGCELISEGVINCSDVMMRKITEKLVYSNAASIVLAHNHPSGLAIPSQADREVTEIIRTQVENIGVQMLDHLVFADLRFASILKKKYGTCRVSPVSQKIDQDFFDNFYQGSDDENYDITPNFPGLQLD